MSTEEIKRKLTYAIHDMAKVYGDEILTDTRFWCLLSERFSFVPKSALCNTLQFCIDEEFIAHIYHYRDNPEVIASNINDWVRKADEEGYDCDDARLILLSASDGIGIMLDNAVTDSLKDRQRLDEDSCSHKIVSTIDCNESSDQIEPTPNNDKRKKYNHTTDITILMLIAIFLAIAISYVIIRQLSNTNETESPAQTTPMDTPSAPLPKLEDLSGMTLEDRNHYLMETRKHTYNNFNVNGIKLGDFYATAERNFIKDNHNEILSDSDYGKRDITCWIKWNGEVAAAYAMIDNLEVYAIHIIFIGPNVDRESLLKKIIDDYGNPEIYLYDGKSQYENYDDVKFGKDVKEYRWTYKNSTAIMKRNNILFALNDRLEQAITTHNK